MGELGFAKQFLTTLDNKSTKYQPDHIFDPTTFQTRSPYTLPKLPHPPHPLPPKTSPAAPPPPGSEAAQRTISVTLKSSRNPTLSLTVPSIDPGSTTIQSLKEKVQSHLGGSSVVGIDKIKILLSKKPIPASKRTVSDALEGGANNGGAKEIEFGVMVIGGAPDPVELTSAKTSTGDATTTPMMGVEKTPNTTAEPANENGKSILETPAFWDDLQVFLNLKIGDQTEAARLRQVFEQSWRDSSNSAP